MKKKSKNNSRNFFKNSLVSFVPQMRDKPEEFHPGVYRPLLAGPGPYSLMEQRRS